MELKDFFFVPVYLILILLLAYRVKPLVTNSHTEKYFIPSLSAKLFGALALGAIYQFYYGGGDTLNYFWDAQRLAHGFFEDSEAGFRVFFRLEEHIDYNFMKVRGPLWYYKDHTSFFVVRTAFIFGLFNMHSYGAIALMFATFSFSGVWMMYYTFSFLKPKLYKWFAYVILFMPSLVFWCSGIMKDTICLAALGWFFYGCYRLFHKNQYNIFTFLVLGISSLVLIKIKIYILLCFAPAAMFWFFLEKTNFSNKNIKVLIRPFILIFGIGVSVFALLKFANSTEEYNIEAITRTSQVTADYLYKVSYMQNGSGYSLSSNFDGSIGSFLRLAPEAVIVSFYRPFLWEARNPVMLLSALEGLAALFLTIYAIMMALKSNRKALFSPPSFVVISLVFAILFGIAIGMSTYNFGSLVRYKTPALPFLMSAMATILFEAKNGIKQS